MFSSSVPGPHSGAAAAARERRAWGATMPAAGSSISRLLQDDRAGGTGTGVGGWLLLLLVAWNRVV